MYWDILYAKSLGISISFIIVGMNLILRYTIVYLIEYIGDDQISHQSAHIVQAVFAAQFFNTGIILLIVNSNLSEHQPKGFTMIFKGPYYDYMPEWFRDVGLKLFLTMVIQCIAPFINLLLTVIILGFGIFMDRGCSSDPFKTK